MRFAIASNDQVTIAGHTGRCGFFVIYDAVDSRAQKVEVRPNTFTNHAQGGCDSHDHSHSHDHSQAGHSHGGLLQALHDCQALISRGMGPRLVTDLQNHGITPLFAGVESVEQAAEQFAGNQLAPSSGNSCTHR